MKGAARRQWWLGRGVVTKKDLNSLSDDYDFRYVEETNVQTVNVHGDGWDALVGIDPIKSTAARSIVPFSAPPFKHKNVAWADLTGNYDSNP